MYVNIPPGRIHVSVTIDARLKAAEPENARQNPVSARMTGFQLIPVNLAGGPTPPKHHIEGCTIADPGSYTVPAARRAFAAALFARTISGRGYQPGANGVALFDPFQRLARNADAKERPWF